MKKAKRWISKSQYAAPRDKQHDQSIGAFNYRQVHVRIQRGRGGIGGPDPPLKYHKNIGSLSNIGPDPL